MPTIAELERENARLRAREEIRREFGQMNRRRRKLKRENRRLRHPARTKLIRTTGKVIKRGGSVLWKGTNRVVDTYLAKTKGMKRIGKVKKARKGKLKPFDISDWI